MDRFLISSWRCRTLDFIDVVFNMASGVGSLCQMDCPEARGNAVPIFVFRRQIKLLGKNLSSLQASAAGRMLMVLREESGS